MVILRFDAACQQDSPERIRVGKVVLLEPSPRVRHMVSFAPMSTVTLRVACDVSKEGVVENAWRLNPVSAVVRGTNVKFNRAGAKAALGQIHALLHHARAKEAAFLMTCMSILPEMQRVLAESLRWTQVDSMQASATTISLGGALAVSIMKPTALVCPTTPLATPAHLRAFYTSLIDSGFKHPECMALCLLNLSAPVHESLLPNRDPAHMIHMFNLLDYMEFLHRTRTLHQTVGATAIPCSPPSIARVSQCFHSDVWAVARVVQETWRPRRAPDLWFSQDGLWFGLNEFLEQEKALAALLSDRRSSGLKSWLVLADAGVGKTCAMAVLARRACGVEDGSEEDHAMLRPDTRSHRGILLATKTNQARKQLEAAMDFFLKDIAKAHLDVTCTTLDMLAVRGLPERSPPEKPFAYVVVDEVSMAECDLLSNIVRGNGGQHLVFIGDEKQLPSVGVGDAIAVLKHSLSPEEIVDFDDTLLPTLPADFVARHPPHVRTFLRSVFSTGVLSSCPEVDSHVRVVVCQDAEYVGDDMLAGLATKGSSTDSRVITFTNRVCESTHMRFLMMWAAANKRQVWSAIYKGGGHSLACVGATLLCARKFHLRIEEIVSGEAQHSDKAGCIVLDTHDRVEISDVLEWGGMAVPKLLQARAGTGLVFTFRVFADADGAVDLKWAKPASCVTVHACQGITVKEDYVVTLAAWYGSRGIDRRFVYTAVTRGKDCRCVALVEPGAEEWMRHNPFERRCAVSEQGHAEKVGDAAAAEGTTSTSPE